MSGGRVPVLGIEVRAFPRRAQLIHTPYFVFSACRIVMGIWDCFSD
jgi:hypothetical protein